MWGLKMTPYKMATLAQVNAVLSNKIVALDLETDGFYGPICLAQFYQADWSEVLIVAEPEIFELAGLLSKHKILAHNTSYEISTIQCQMGAYLDSSPMKWLPKAWEDTLLLSKLKWFDKDRYSLDYCYTYMLGYDPYVAQGLDKKVMQKTNWAGQISKSMLEYAATDVFYLLELYETCSEQLDSDSYKLDKVATTCAFSFQTNGLAIDEDRINQLINENDKEVARLAVPVNVNSWKQVRPYIEENESDGLALATFALEGNDRAKNVQAARKLLKQNSFLNKFLNEAIDGRIYGKFTFTTKSGRGNCSKQNLQQLPRKTKGCFVATEGNVLVMSDYAQLELRYGCAYTGEPAMEARFKNGEDLHQYTADMMCVPRQQAKTCNFNLLYGGSANMLQSIFIKECDMLLPIQQVRAMKKKWHNLWRILTQWQDETTSAWRNGLPQQTLLGRQFKSKLYTDAMNLPIQGGAAEIAKLAMHKMFKKLHEYPELEKEVKFVNFIHDSFMWECPSKKEHYELLSEITATAMKEAWEELAAYTKIPDLPMPVEILVGKNWGDLDKGIETPTYKLEV